MAVAFCCGFFCLLNVYHPSLQRPLPRRWHRLRRGENAKDVAVLRMMLERRPSVFFFITSFLFYFSPC